MTTWQWAARASKVLRDLTSRQPLGATTKARPLQGESLESLLRPPGLFFIQLFVLTLSVCSDLGSNMGREDPMEKGMAPTPVFLPGQFHGQRSLVGYSPWGRRESDTTEQLTNAHTSSPHNMLPNDPLLPSAPPPG